MPTAPDPPPQTSDPGPAPRQGLREIDLILPLAVAICIVLGWYVFLDYEQLLHTQVAATPSIAARVLRMRLVLGLASVGGLGLALLAARDARRRRVAEAALLVAHAALARRMARRTDILRLRTRALREARLRERLAASEAEAAFAAGRLEAAGAYLHAVGNSLSALDLELLRLSRALAAAPRLAAAFATLAQDIRSSDSAKALATAAILEETVLVRAMPRLVAGVEALAEVKEQMTAALERHRGEFERRVKTRPYLQEVRLNEEVAAILDRMPRSAGSDPVVRDLAENVRIRTRKQPFLAGLAALLRQALDAATASVTVRLEKASGGRAVLVLEGVGLPEIGEAAVAAGINFLNENGGAVRHKPAEPGRPSRLIIEIADRFGEPASGEPGLS
ncbi:hypothetical protein GTA51_13405 [Desulfovibrio aerotolerans]|uniref:Uncharacterized protein n=1 Tax=Solidesulfovibrio aerotolerans TaxID=295255 RepID=A0A7C9IMN6_9BACT|nr:hypothetical protein [Solidesulfovibrio aerotolerans]MYL84124.1 hypothetical protein [Solidesulfovibrio aerotolerans]